jgi:hypothetical protein
MQITGRHCARQGRHRPGWSRRPSRTLKKTASGMCPSSSATRPTTFRTEKLLSENAHKITDGNETVAECMPAVVPAQLGGQPSQLR